MSPRVFLSTAIVLRRGVYVRTPYFRRNFAAGADNARWRPRDVSPLSDLTVTQVRKLFL